MFTLEFLIDSFQNGKKQFVNACVTHEGVKHALIEFVDTQTDYTKSAVKATSDITNKLAAESTKALVDLAKFDISKLVKTSK